MLGAKEAAKTSNDARELHAFRSQALAEFDKALAINPFDADALEYSIMMLLELANSVGSLGRLDQLIEIRKNRGGGFDLARAYRLQARAYESLPVPQLGNANSALLNAVQHMPDDLVYELARTHEHHGIVRMKAGMNGVANASFQNALIRYQAMRDTPEGTQGLARVTAAIAELNQNPGNAIHDANVSQDDASTSWFRTLTTHEPNQLTN